MEERGGRDFSLFPVPRLTHIATREIGVRLALGAHAGAVLRMVLVRGGQLALIGIVVGTAGTFALRSVLANLLFNVSATDPFIYGGVAILLAGIALLACFIPARRAAAHGVNVEAGPILPKTSHESPASEQQQTCWKWTKAPFAQT